MEDKNIAAELDLAVIVTEDEVTEFAVRDRQDVGH